VPEPDTPEELTIGRTYEPSSLSIAGLTHATGSVTVSARCSNTARV
jgi:hypothetical protein